MCNDGPYLLMYSLLHLWKERSAFAALAKASIANITHAQRRGIIFSCSGKQTGRQRVQSMKGVYGFARHLSASGIHFWHSSGGVLRFSARLPSRIFREWTGTHSQTRRTQSRRLKHARLDAKDGGCARDTRMSHPTDHPHAACQSDTHFESAWDEGPVVCGQETAGQTKSTGERR